MRLQKYYYVVFDTVVLLILLGARYFFPVWGYRVCATVVLVALLQHAYVFATAGLVVLWQRVLVCATAGLVVLLQLALVFTTADLLVLYVRVLVFVAADVGVVWQLALVFTAPDLVVRRQRVLVCATADLVVLLHLVLAYADATYYMTQITMSAYYALVVIGLCLLMGYAGQASLGHAGFFAIGGYTSAVLTTYNLTPYSHTRLIALCQSLGLTVQWKDLYGSDILSFTPWMAFAAALLLTALIALGIGASVIRLKGHYLAMATLGFGLIVYFIAKGTPVLGQADGVSNVPPFHLLGGLQVNGRAPFRVQNYYIAWGAVLIAMVLALNLVHSRVGRALRSIHENEEAAHSLGVNTYRYKLAVFVLSAVFAAVGGVLLTHYNGSIGPAEASVMKSVRYVAIVAVGGMANLWGAMIMGIVLNFLSLRGVFGSYDDTVFGGILIVMMVFAPQGLLRVPRLQAIGSLLSRRSHE